MSETHTSPHPGATPETPQPVAQRRTPRRRAIVRVSFLVGIIGAMAILNRSLENGADSVEQPTQQTQVADAVTNQPPIAAAPAPRQPKTSSEANRDDARIAKSTKPRPVATAKPSSVAPREKTSLEERPAPDNAAVSATLVASDVMQVADAVTSASAAMNAEPPVTITGCLEVSTDGEQFRLADTDGADAPKSRSWRTGFLATRRVPVALVESTESLGLMSSVGKRVAATGHLTNRILQVHALQVVDPSCD